MEVPGKATANWNELLSANLGSLKRTSFGQYSPGVLEAVVKPALVPAYNQCGVQSAAEADYGGEHIFIADLGTTLGAMCIFAQEKTLDGKPIAAYDGPQGEGYTRPGRTFVRRGRFYFSVKGSNESFGGGKGAVALVTEILKKIPDATKPDAEIERLRALPMMGRIPGSERYVPQSVFGFSALPRGFTADYGCGEAGLGLAHAAVHADKHVSELFEAVEKEAAAKGYQTSATAFGDKSVMLKKQGNPTFYLVMVGGQLGMAELDGGEIAVCEHVMREFVKVLKTN